ncbi:MAG: hypothetical protein J7L52_09060 [Thermotogae bacterium]|nr:hypothetical protein [Thermotogota bacterium]
MVTAKEKLINIIQNLDERVAEKLLEELDDILLQIELENDPDFMGTVRRVEAGEEELIPHEEVVKLLKSTNHDPLDKKSIEKP